MEEELNDELDGIIYQHRDLYSFIKDKYEYDEYEDLFIIGKSNLDTIIQIGYNYEDKHFMLCVFFNGITVYVLSFTEKKHFDSIIKLMVKNDI